MVAAEEVREQPGWEVGPAFSLAQRFLTGLALVVVLAWPAQASSGDSPEKDEVIGDGALVTVLPPNRIPALTNPTFLTRAQGDPLMRDDEPVLGLIDPATGQAKAYSLWFLEWHEIVNDRLGDKPVAVTW